MIIFNYDNVKLTSTVCGGPSTYLYEWVDGVLWLCFFVPQINSVWLYRKMYFDGFHCICDVCNIHLLQQYIRKLIMAYEYKLPLTYSVNNANNCTSLFSKYTHILLG